MDDKNPKPYEIKSFIDINKKRKLEAEQLGLPLSKHQCWNLPTLGSIAEVEGFTPCTFKGKAGSVYNVSETESAKDSNSFAEDSDTAMSTHVDAKYLLSNGASSSSPIWGSSSQGSHSYGTAVALSGVGKYVPSSPGEEPETADAKLVENLEETLAEYGSDIDYIYLGYGNYTIEQYRGKEIEETLNSDGADSNVYVLSSRRWSVNREAPQTQRKPTIDQEFEHYFSTLML